MNSSSYKRGLSSSLSLSRITNWFPQIFILTVVILAIQVAYHGHLSHEIIALREFTITINLIKICRVVLETFTAYYITVQSLHLRPLSSIGDMIVVVGELPLVHINDMLTCIDILVWIQSLLWSVLISSYILLIITFKCLICLLGKLIIGLREHIVVRIFEQCLALSSLSIALRHLILINFSGFLIHIGWSKNICILSSSFDTTSRTINRHRSLFHIDLVKRVVHIGADCDCTTNSLLFLLSLDLFLQFNVSIDDGHALTRFWIKIIKVLDWCFKSFPCEHCLLLV